MINRWDRGRAEVDQLLKQGRLTRVAANRDLAERHLAQAQVIPTACRPHSNALQMTYCRRPITTTKLTVRHKSR